MKKQRYIMLVVILIWGVAMLAVLCVAFDNSSDLFDPVRAAPLMGESTITEVVPSSAPNDLNIPIVITGNGFISGTEVMLDGTSLENVDWISSTRLTTSVPWGMAPGVYTMTITNPDGQQGSLAKAFTVTQGLGVWTTGGPYGGIVQELLMDPVTSTTLYTPIFNVGLLATYDGATHWQPILVGGYIHPAVDTQNPEVIYAGGGGGLLRSLDGGTTWESITILDPSVGCFMHDPVTHPASLGVVYIGTRACPSLPAIPGEGGIYRSQNYGANWLTITVGLTDTHITTIAFHPQDYDFIAAGTDTGNLFVSDDGGQTWVWRARVGSHIERFYFNAFEEYEAWAIPLPDWPHQPPYLYRSVDPNLQIWMPVSVTEHTGDLGLVYALDFISDTIFAATSSGVHTSTDSGESWMQVGGIQQGASDLVIDPQNSDVMYIGSIPGVRKTNDGGSTWNEANEGLAGVVPIALTVSPVDPDSVYVKTHELGLLKSYNGGRAWISVGVWEGGPPAPGILAVDPFTQTRLYLADHCAGIPCIRIGEDEDEWSDLVVNLPNTPEGWCGEGSAIGPHPSEPGRILAGAELYRCDEPEDERTSHGQIYISHDFGTQWTSVASGQSISRVVKFAFDNSDPNLVYAATDGTGLFKSTDGGMSWYATSFPGFPSINSVVVHPSVTHSVYALSFDAVGEEGTRLYLSKDAGTTWVEMPFVPTLPGIEYGYELLFVPTQPATLYTGCAGDISGLCRSRDGGFTWELVEGAPRVIVLTSGSDGDRVIVYIGTGGGVTTYQTGAAAISDTIPGKGAVIGGGVYRLATRLADQWLFLPLVSHNR